MVILYFFAILALFAPLHFTCTHAIQWVPLKLLKTLQILFLDSINSLEPALTEGLKILEQFSKEEEKGKL